MVWGCMSSHGVGRLHIVSGTVKAMDYIEILQNKLLPTARDLLGNQSWIFQDDNAPCHRAKKAYEVLTLMKTLFTAYQTQKTIQAMRKIFLVFDSGVKLIQVLTLLADLVLLMMWA
ncbi:hypothetical protein TNCV_2595511 [Trichonephila clavipes]|nr:hypothetical protein TNCV_2595511 [Trichonephila clavipes]